MRSPAEYAESQDHIPAQFRDFHDQKDLFKTIDGAIDWEVRGGRPVGWIDAHIYVIDIFLWYMAKRGWTLQRSRAKVDFLSYDQDNRDRQARESKAFAALLNSELTP